MFPFVVVKFDLAENVMKKSENISFSVCRCLVKIVKFYLMFPELRITRM